MQPPDNPDNRYFSQYFLFHLLVVVSSPIPSFRPENGVVVDRCLSANICRKDVKSTNKKLTMMADRLLTLHFNQCTPTCNSNPRLRLNILFVMSPICCNDGMHSSRRGCHNFVQKQVYSFSKNACSTHKMLLFSFL